MANTNSKLPFVLAGVAVAMLCAAFASKPLYDTFCRVTGYGGTTQRGGDGAGVVLDREMTVRFDSNVARGVPVDFKPEQNRVRGRVGETQLAYYRAENTSDRTVSLTATFNVTPFKAGPYFRKLECFCFTEQTLAPGEAIDMPVIFYVDPKIADDDFLDDVSVITLSYTFFETEGAESADLAAAPRDLSGDATFRASGSGGEG